MNHVFFLKNKLCDLIQIINFMNDHVISFILKKKKSNRLEKFPPIRFRGKHSSFSFRCCKQLGYIL